VSRWPNKHVIGLTGNIAVGKSVVRQMLQHLGAHTIDADGLAHQAMSPGAPAYQPIVDTFGTVILNEDKTINRPLLGSMVFSNPALLQKLESITHPVIGKAIDTLINHSKKRVIVIEAIKLLEGDLVNSVNEVWVVDANPKVQYTRLITKRKMTEDEAKRRILAQNPQADKLKKANVVITNDNDIEATWKQVQTAWNIIKGKLSTTVAPAPPASSATTPTAPASAPTPATPRAASVNAVTTLLQREDVHSAIETAEAPVVDTSGVSVRRGMPTHAEVIANFINKETGKSVQRLDVIMSFGQKSYLIAEFEGKVVGVIGWQVENLITRVDELYVDNISIKQRVIYAMLQATEKASFELQSEVSFVFLPHNTTPERVALFTQVGYEPTTIEQIKVPAWREAVQELYTEGSIVLGKPLRTERILKPI
jgi:dephospho-CoA kinase